MTGAGRDTLDTRVLVLAPTGKDAALTRSTLDRAGVASVCFPDLEQVGAALELGAGALLLAEEAVAQGGKNLLTDWIAHQPPWSDLPILVLARPGADSAAVAQAMELLGNVTVLERPTRVAALVSAVRTALRARRRQYEAREHLARIERSERELREADRRKDEFLAVLAHELRNPLAPIRSSLHILRLTSHEPSVGRAGEVMERQVNHMVRLVDDLLEVSRITRGKIELRKQTVEVTAIVRSAVETSRPLIDAAGHRLFLAIPPEPLILEGDPLRLAQVLANLLNNAAKYTEPGGQIFLSVRRENETVAISVRDTGIGISREMLPRVFELFTQGDGNAQRAQGGLGIGLTLAKSLVEMHGGSISGYSDGSGRGSEFVVHLPLVAAQSVAAESVAADPVAAQSVEPIDEAKNRSSTGRGRKRVVVVDDNNDAAETLGSLLELLGADVHVAHSGSEALSALPTYRPDAVLLDIGMPGMDGHEVARRIRQQPAYQGITLIALTGAGQEAGRDPSEAAGFDYLLSKPADVTAIQTLLDSLEDGRVDPHPVGHRS